MSTQQNPSSGSMGRQKNIVVIGSSYVGSALTSSLLPLLPSLNNNHLPPTTTTTNTIIDSPSTSDPIKQEKMEEYRIIQIEKNSHFGHLFAYPRYALTDANGSSQKAFIPFVSPSPSLVRLRAKVLNVRPGYVELDREVEGFGKRVDYEALVLATGTKLTPPGTLPGETKEDGVEWFLKHQEEVEKAKRIVIIGGGAVGVQMATDIPILFNEKQEEESEKKSVTLIHSRHQLMPRFHPQLSSIVKQRFSELGVETLLGSRAKVPIEGWESIRSGGIVELEDGRTVQGDLIILATGQTPLSDPLKTLAPSAIASNGFISVHPTFQIKTSGQEGNGLKFPNVFALGDIADSGAPKAARPGAVQAELVAKNLISSLSNPSLPLEEYKPGAGAIHLTLGIKESVIFRNPSSGGEEPVVTFKDDGREDMGIEGVWKRRAPGITDYKL